MTSDAHHGHMIPDIKVDMMPLIKFLFSLVNPCCRSRNTGPYEGETTPQTPRPTINIPEEQFKTTKVRLLRRSARLEALRTRKQK
jgi:hypothetical protein